jgi:hypothetical protein
MTWSHVTKVAKIKTRLGLTGYKHEGQVGGFGAMDHVAVKFEQGLPLMDEGNGEEQVRSRSMNQQGHVMI